MRVQLQRDDEFNQVTNIYGEKTNLYCPCGRNTVGEVSTVEVTLQTPDGKNEFGGFDFLLDFGPGNATNIDL